MNEGHRDSSFADTQASCLLHVAKEAATLGSDMPLVNQSSHSRFMLRDHREDAAVEPAICRLNSGGNGFKLIAAEGLHRIQDGQIVGPSPMCGK